MASVRKRDPSDPKSPWVVDYKDAEGKRRLKTPKSGLKKDADKLRQQIERELADATHTPSRQSATVAAVVELYLRHIEQRTRDGVLSRSRLKLSTSVLTKHVVPHVGAVKFSELTFNQVEDLHRKMRATDMQSLTAKHYLLMFRQVEDFAVKRGFTAKRHVQEVLREIKGIMPPKIRTFTAEQVRELLIAAEIRPPRNRILAYWVMRLAVNLAAFCGLRFGEIMALSKDHVDIHDGVIHVRHSLNSDDIIVPPKTAAGLRDVPMPPHIRLLFMEFARQHYVENPRRLLFRLTTGKPIQHTDFRNNWISLLERAQLIERDDRDVFHFHALRHFASSLMIEKGIPMPDVAALMGHAKFDMTLQTYAHPIVPGHRRHAVFERMAGDLLRTDATNKLTLPANP